MARGGLLKRVLGCGWLCIGTAYAFPQEHLKEARDGLLAADRKATRTALDLAYTAFAEAEGIIPNDVLASYWYYKGLVALERKKNSRAMDEFRQALTVDNEFQWDRELSDSMDMRRLFEALRSEVQGRDVVSPKVPKKVGEAQMYVDGTRVRHGDWAAVGMRLAQVQCPKGDVYGVWNDFSKNDDALDWLAMCPYEVDTSVVVVAMPVEDDFGMDAFGDEGPAAAEIEASTAEDTPAVAVAEETTEETPDEKSGGIVGGIVTDEGGEPLVVPPKTEEAEKETDSTVVAHEVVDRQSFWTGRNIVMLAGGGLVTGGVVAQFTVVKPSRDMVEWGRRNPTELSRYQADILTERFVQRRAASVAVLGAGVAVVGTGYFFMKPTSSVQPYFSVLGAGLHGRW